MFTPEEGEGGEPGTGQGGTKDISATHHPFTAPRSKQDLELLRRDPLAAAADHYDLVINGVEVGGGSRRIHVAEVQEYVFREVLGMTIRHVDGDPAAPRQVWTIGGMQFIQDPGFDGPEGRLAHLGVMTIDLDAALEAAKPFGVAEMPQGRNWLRLPDWLAVEIMQATGRAVDEALAVDPRA